MNEASAELQTLLETLADEFSMGVKEFMYAAGYVKREELDKAVDDAKKYTDMVLMTEPKMTELVTKIVNDKLRLAIDEEE